jgi:phage terminase large subunit-like protein
MSPALANLERLLLERQVVHDNPCLSMCISQTTIRMDAAGNRAPDKKRAMHKIDGTVALLQALAQIPAAQASSICIEALIG